jgi:hypothetical protein
LNRRFQRDNEHLAVERDEAAARTSTLGARPKATVEELEAERRSLQTGAADD